MAWIVVFMLLGILLPLLFGESGNGESGDDYINSEPTERLMHVACVVMMWMGVVVHRVMVYLNKRRRMLREMSEERKESEG